MAASISAGVIKSENVKTPVRSKLSENNATHTPLRRNWPFGQKHCELFWGDTRPAGHAAHAPDTPT